MIKLLQKLVESHKYVCFEAYQNGSKSKICRQGFNRDLSLNFEQTVFKDNVTNILFT